MRKLIINNHIITEPIINILLKLQLILTNGKLRDISVKSENIIVSCPHHSGGHENKAGCTIYIGDSKDIPIGYTNCFVCGFKGTFDKFVAECFDCSLDFATNWLIKNFGKQTDDFINLGPPIILNKIKNTYLDPSILEQYQEWTPYLAERKLDMTVCKGFSVKYDPKYRQILFPIFDKNNRLLMIPKRNIDTKVFFLDKNVEKPLYGFNIIEQNQITSCMIVEGLIDLLTCYTNKVPAIATMGAPSIQQINNINKSSIKHLYICFDNDLAGLNFTNFVDTWLDPRIIKTYIKLPNNKKDVNDLDSCEWQELISKYSLPIKNLF